MACRRWVIATVVTLVAGATAACSSHAASGVDAATDGPAATDGLASAADVHLDVTARDRSGEHAYADAAPPGALGTPLPKGAVGVWNWINFADSRCRDGSSTGLGLNIGSSRNVMVFLDQGGACFDSSVCLFNAASYGAAEFGGGMSQGIFNRADPDNPLRDYNFVFIPYCTGDVHSGNNPSGSLDGVDGPQQFVGYKNLDVFLARVVPTFPDASQVLFVGSSAGGFGVLLNADHAARWFAPIPVTVLSDSGPPMTAAVAEPCLQQRWNDLWGFRNAVLGDCAGDCPLANDYMIDDLFHFVWRYPSYRIALISSIQDATIDFFFSYGYMNCAGGTIPPANYEAGLLDLRSELQQAGQTSFSTYYIPDTRHIWLMTDAGFATSVGGVPLKQWVGNLLGGASVSVGP
jgi:hypothetical protein